MGLLSFSFSMLWDIPLAVLNETNILFVVLILGGGLAWTCIIRLAIMMSKYFHGPLAGHTSRKSRRRATLKNTTKPEENNQPIARSHDSPLQLPT